MDTGLKPQDEGLDAGGKAASGAGFRDDVAPIPAKKVTPSNDVDCEDLSVVEMQRNDSVGVVDVTNEKFLDSPVVEIISFADAPE